MSYPSRLRLSLPSPGGHAAQLNDLTFLRMRSKKHEIMVAPGAIAWRLFRLFDLDNLYVSGLLCLSEPIFPGVAYERRSPSLPSLEPSQTKTFFSLSFRTRMPKRRRDEPIINSDSIYLKRRKWLELRFRTACSCEAARLTRWFVP